MSPKARAVVGRGKEEPTYVTPDVCVCVREREKSSTRLELKFLLVLFCFVLYKRANLSTEANKTLRNAELTHRAASGTGCGEERFS